MAKGLKALKFFNNKRTFTIPESVGLSEEEQNRIITLPKFDDFVINIESLNFIFLRDEREVQANVYIRTEKEVLYGQTLKFPYPKSTNFTELLEKFNTKKRRAIDVEELEQQDDVAAEDTKVESKEETFIHPSVVEKTSETIDEESSSNPTLDEAKVSTEELEEAFGNEEDVEEEQMTELKECEKCGFENDINAKFCSECGANLLNIGQDTSKTVHEEVLQTVSEQAEQGTAIVGQTSEYQSSLDDMQQLLKVKDGLKNRSQIEKDVALEFESKKAAAIKAADDKVEEEKRKELEILNRTFKEKQEVARTNALEVLSVDEKNEVNSRVNAMKNYLKQIYETGLRSIDEGINMKSANE
ncbi:zinc ribbon domain-containing protein (plasmid) [Lactococcus formosensis]|uniref:zinc ribbon domain-containing protein n=1 Tax=Lactococcus formosensis TaxID=1281486 RepID=UPI0030D38EC2